MRAFICPGFSPRDIGAKIRYAGRLPHGYDFERDNVIQPVMTASVRMLSRNSHGVMLRREPALEPEVNLDFVTRFELAEVDVFNDCIGAINIHADTIPD
jgi:hypothetical protein